MQTMNGSHGDQETKERERMGGSAQNNVDITSLSKSIYLGLHHVLDFSRLTLIVSHPFYKERNEWLSLHYCISRSKLQI